MRDSPTGVHTDEMRQEAVLNTHMLIYAFLKQEYERNQWTSSNLFNFCSVAVAETRKKALWGKVVVGDIIHLIFLAF